MAIVLKKKTAAKADQQELLSDFADLIDKVGQLQKEAGPVAAEIKKLTEKLKPLKDAEKELQEKLDELNLHPDATGEELGAVFRCEIGKKGTSREITDMPKLKKFLGDELFMKLASVKLGDIDDYLTPPQREQVLTENRTKRSFKIIERAA